MAYDTNPEASEEPYSVFSIRQKATIMALATFAGWFSSISSFIYFPAIPAMAQDLGETIERLNLTVTSYLIVSGIVPSLVGSAADRFGRRPVLIIALGVYLASNIGLALQSNFALLFILRMVQSAGISGTFSITYGVLGDLFTPAERGGYSGTVALFLNTPPSIGPLISGLLLLRWSWRSIFWFLCASSFACLTATILFLPETARQVVDNGAKKPAVFNRPFLSTLVPRHTNKRSGSIMLPGESRSLVNPFTTLKLLRFPGTTCVLVAYAIGYSVYSCLQASLSTLFLTTYDVSGLTSGLIYLPFGVACALSAYLTGFLLDYHFRKTATQMGMIVDRKKADDLLTFPIETARLKTILYFVTLSAMLIMGYGWQLQASVDIPGPLVTQFFIGLSLQTMFTALNTLLVDLHQDCPSTAQAACNLFRCELAAGLSAALDIMTRHLGIGWTFILLGSLVFLAVGSLVTTKIRGLSWRQKGKQLSEPHPNATVADSSRHTHGKEGSV